MRFLIVTTQRQAPPPEMMLPLIHAMKEWLAENRSSGRIVEAWNFAGAGGGGGIAEVASHEELEGLMGTFPFGPFSDMATYALSDLDASLDLAEANMAQMLESVG